MQCFRKFMGNEVYFDSLKCAYNNIRSPIFGFVLEATISVVYIAWNRTDIDGGNSKKTV